MKRNSPESDAVEAEARRRLSEAWNVQILKIGEFDDVDFLAIRDGRTRGVGEIKGRNVAKGKYDTVYFSVKKYEDLGRFAAAFHAEAVFVVSYTDRLCFLDLRKVDPSWPIIMAGNSRKEEPNDVELVILVPVSVLRDVR